MNSPLSEAPILSEIRPAGGGRRVAVVTLNAGKSLNALTLDMAQQLTALLREWQHDAGIACVVLRGSGDKAFCAGGDVVRLHQSAVSADGYAQTFFEQEYRLDYLIHTYGKPIIVWGHGIVMGGGLGLLAGANHRVVTAETRMAMPEVTIGLYPDVGGTWFLNRMPGRTGLFLALTGASLNANDALFLGLADVYLQHAQQAEVIQALCDLPWSADAEERDIQTTRLLHGFAAGAGQRPEGNVRPHFDVIQAMTSHARLAHVIDAITSYAGQDAWLAKAAATLRVGCPASVRLIPEVLKRGLHLSLREAFQFELILSTNCVRLGNFQEGVRALLIDKDRQPHYAHASFADIDHAYLELHFQPPWGEQPHPLADL